MGRVVGFVDNGLASVINDHYATQGFQHLIPLTDFDTAIQRLVGPFSAADAAGLRFTFLRNTLEQVVSQITVAADAVQATTIIVTGLQTPAEVDFILQTSDTNSVFKIVCDGAHDDVFSNLFYILPEIILTTQEMVAPVLNSLVF